MKRRNKAHNKKIALICSVGFATAWHPFGISLLKENIEANTNINVDNYYLSSEFTYYIKRYHPEFREIDNVIGEDGHSYHELYYSAKIFRHESPKRLVEKALFDMFNYRDIYRHRIIEKYNCRNNRRIISALAEFVLEYCKILGNFIKKKIRIIEQENYDLIGFSCLSSQLLCSIYMAEQIKHNFSGIILFGGGMFRRWNIKQFKEIFPFIDDFIAGDGYEPIISYILKKNELLKAIKGKKQNHYGDFSDIPKRIIQSGNFWIPIQLSENCSWSKCLFCGIKPSRICLKRSPELVARWIEWFTKEYGNNYFGFVDCNMNNNIYEISELCNHLIKNENQSKLYGMFNTQNLDKKTCEDIKLAGFENILLGIESFSNEMLKILHKKATVIDNIKALKWLVEANVSSICFNLIVDFFGVNKKIIKENHATYKCIEHLFRKNVGFDLIEFDLERDSIAYKQAKKNKMKGLSNYRFNEICYPKNIRKIMKFHKVKYNWKRIPSGWENLEYEKNNMKNKLLFYQKEAGNITITDTRESKKIYKLSKAKAKIYDLICNDILDVNDIHDMCKEELGLIKRTLEDFTNRRLAVKENNKYFGIAISKNRTE